VFTDRAPPKKLTAVIEDNGVDLIIC
jgi:hypothetical protein